MANGLYETRLNRIIANNRKELNQLQAVRKAVEAKALEEAELVLMNELAAQQGQASGLIPTHVLRSGKIQVNGFVFSNADLYDNLHHKQVIAEARWYKTQGWNYSKLPPFTLLNFPKAA